jgi:hypothetical protein
VLKGTIAVLLESSKVQEKFTGMKGMDGIQVRTGSGSDRV